MLDAMGKAWLDLVAMFLILAGTWLITQVGVPTLVGKPVAYAKEEVVFGDQEIIHGFKPDSEAAVRRYLKWARFGFGFITLGVAWQALTPISVLCPNAKFLAAFRPGPTPPTVPVATPQARSPN